MGPQTADTLVETTHEGPLSSPTDESQLHASTAEPPSGTKIQKTVARKARAASPKGKSSGGKDTRQAKREPTHEPPPLNAAVKAQKSAAKTGPSGPKWGGMLCRGTWSNSDGSSCFINAALSFLSLLPWHPTLPVECPDLLREAHVAILAMRAGRDTTLSAHRTRVRTALVAAFPEEACMWIPTFFFTFLSRQIGEKVEIQCSGKKRLDNRNTPKGTDDVQGKV